MRASHHCTREFEARAARVVDGSPPGLARRARKTPAMMARCPVPCAIVVSARLGAFPEHLAFSDQAPGADDDLRGGKGGGPSSQVSCGPVGLIQAAIRPPRELSDLELSRVQWCDARISKKY